MHEKDAKEAFTAFGEYLLELANYLRRTGRLEMHHPILRSGRNEWTTLATRLDTEMSEDNRKAMAVVLPKLKEVLPRVKQAGRLVGEEKVRVGDELDRVSSDLLRAVT